MARRLEKLSQPPPLWDRLQNGDSHAGRSMRCRKAGLASARVNEVRGWPNLQKAWEARRLYLAEDRQRRLIEEQQLEFLRLREAKREMLRRWGIDPNAPKSTFTDDLSRLRRI
jgi:hypothetical protein